MDQSIVNLIKEYGFYFKTTFYSPYEHHLYEHVEYFTLGIYPDRIVITDLKSNNLIFFDNIDEFILFLNINDRMKKYSRKQKLIKILNGKIN